MMVVVDIFMARKVLAVALLAFNVMSLVAQVSCSMTKDNGKYVWNGETAIQYGEVATYCSAVLWALEHEAPAVGKETPPNFNFVRMVLDQKSEMIVEKAERTYCFRLHIGVEPEKLLFGASEVKCIPKGALAALKVVTLDKLNLEKKPQNQMYIDEFNSSFSEFITKVVADIVGTEVKVQYWDEIVKGHVQKGMTPVEVKLSKGNPSRISENSQRIVWTYESGTIIMFENDRVTGIVN